MLKTLKDAELTPCSFAVGDDRFIVSSALDDKVFLLCVDIPRYSNNYPDIIFTRINVESLDESIPHLIHNNGQVYQLDLPLSKRELCFEYNKVDKENMLIRVSHRCLNKPVIEEKVNIMSVISRMEEIKNTIPDILKLENLSFLYKAKESKKKKVGRK